MCPSCGQKLRVQSHWPTGIIVCRRCELDLRWEPTILETVEESSDQIVLTPCESKPISELRSLCQCTGSKSCLQCKLRAARHGVMSSRFWLQTFLVHRDFFVVNSCPSCQGSQFCGCRAKGQPCTSCQSGASICGDCSTHMELLGEFLLGAC